MVYYMHMYAAILNSMRILYHRAEDSMMAVIPDISCMEGALMTNGSLRVSLFLVRIDGVIYPTGTYIHRIY